MAATARKYGQSAVYGSLAYDFNNPELYGEEYSRPQTPAARPKQQTRTRVRTRARAAARTKQSIAPLSLIGVAVAAFVFVIGIMAQIQLFEVSSQNVALQSQLSVLEEDQAKLRISYESAFNLAEIEEYATASLGMQRPSADQIFYIDTSAPDKALVLSDGGGDSFAERVADFLSGLGAYFG